MTFACFAGSGGDPTTHWILKKKVRTLGAFGVLGGASLVLGHHSDKEKG
jgi:hypothetical protein